jgi:hypothetical protein
MRNILAPRSLHRIRTIAMRDPIASIVIDMPNAMRSESLTRRNNPSASTC